MDIKTLQTLVIDALEDVKAQDILLYETAHLTSLFDRLVIASGTSNRQTKALAASVRDKVKQAGGDVVGVEGDDTGEWVLVDLGDMIVHIMQPAIRAYYRLEEIWGDKEIKLGAAKRLSKRTASSEDGEAKPKRTSRHLVAATQASVDDDEPKKPARKPRATSAKTADAVAPAKKAPAAKKAVGKTVKVAASKTATASKAAAKRAPAKAKSAE